MEYIKIDVPKSRLLKRTIELLRERPRKFGWLAEIEQDTGLPKAWLSTLLKGSCTNISPSVDRIVVLYEYLSGHKIDVI